MRNRRPLSPFLPLALTWVAFAGYVWLTAGQLPARVATHFDLKGEPNGWERQTGYLCFTLAMGAVIPIFIMGIFIFTQYLDGYGLNIPHKDYWLAPERRGQTFAFIQRQGAAFAALLIAFFAGIHFAIIAANAHRPASLPSTLLAWIVGSFLGATVSWCAFFIGHFFRRPA